MSAPTSGQAAVAAATPDTQIIKQSIALRAKYRTGPGPEPQIMTMPPYLVVPHPKNRGGDPVVSLRTKELVQFIAKSGCDPSEARSCAIAVESMPITAPPIRGRLATKTRDGGDERVSFQKHFERQTASDPDMAKKLDGVEAVLGTLSHSHLNCSLRNIRAGMLGCLCGQPGQTCGCGVKPLLDDKGCYSLAALRKSDDQWANLVEMGIP